MVFCFIGLIQILELFNVFLFKYLINNKNKKKFLQIIFLFVFNLNNLFSVYKFIFEGLKLVKKVKIKSILLRLFNWFKFYNFC